MPIELFVEHWMQALGDRAADMRKDGGLMLCARLHAAYLDSRIGDELQQSMHMGRNGTTANERVRAAGYSLPGWWPVAGNQVECCVRIGDDPASALRVLLASPAHRALMLREDWYKAHTVYGVGHAGSDWVVLAAPQES